MSDTADGLEGEYTRKDETTSSSSESGSDSTSTSGDSGLSGLTANLPADLRPAADYLIAGTQNAISKHGVVKTTFVVSAISMALSGAVLAFKYTQQSKQTN
jgi:hypothetical protein